MDLRKIHIAIKAIWDDGTEGFETASKIVGENVALGILAMFLWDSHNPRGGQWPQKDDTVDAVNKILEDSGIFNQTFPTGVPAKFQLFVRWFHEHHDAGGMVELARNGKIILSESVYSNDGVHGFCRAIVRLLPLSGFEVEMPMCLQGYGAPNRNRED